MHSMTDMQDKNTRLVDHGWNAMHDTLDKEMPAKKDKRRSFIWWIFGLSLLLLVTTVVISSNLYFGKSNDQLVNQQNNYPIAEQIIKSENINQKQAKTETSSITSSGNRSVTNKPAITSENKNVQYKTPDELESNPETTKKSIHNLLTENDINKSQVNQKVTPSPLSNDSQIALANRNTINIENSTDINKQDKTNGSSDVIMNTDVNITGDNTQIKKPSIKIYAEELSTIQKNNQAGDLQIGIIESQADNDQKLDQITTSDLTENRSQATIPINENLIEKTITEPTNRSSLNIKLIDSPIVQLLEITTSKPIKLRIAEVPFIINPAAEKFKMYTSLLIGGSGSYNYDAKSLGYGVHLDLSIQLSKRMALSAGIEYGKQRLSSMPDLSPSGTDASQQGPETNNDPSVPQGPQEVGDQMDNSGAGAAPGESVSEKIELSEAEINLLQRVNLESLHYIRPSLRTSYNFNNAISGGISFGADYFYNASFDDEVPVSFTNADIDAIRTNFLPLAFENQWIPSVEADISYHIAKSFRLKFSHRHYLKNLFNDSNMPLKLHQLRLGFVYTIPLQRK